MTATKDPGKMNPMELYQWKQARGARVRRHDEAAEADDYFAGEIQVTPLMDLLPGRKAERRRRPA